MDAEPGDIIVIGGGPIGCALCCALRDAGLDITLLEARSEIAAHDDARTLALSWGSHLILQRLGVWDTLADATPIRRIHVSQRGGFGRTELRAEEVCLPALGFVVRYGELHAALHRQALASGARLLSGIAASDLRTEGDWALVMTGAAQAPMRCRLAVIADGGVALSAQAGARLRTIDYRQCAVVGVVSTDQPHGNRAYERFTEEGPLALLPRDDGFALVWSCAPDQASELLDLDDDYFLARLQRRFGARAGRFTGVRGRATFPLMLRFANRPAMPRVEMLGNAAQALHPIAGQGFNLGLRDSFELADAILHERQHDPGGRAVLQRFRRGRNSDRLAGIAMTDALTRLFSNELVALSLARGLGIAALDIFPPAKRFLMRRMIFGSAL